MSEKKTISADEAQRLLEGTTPGAWDAGTIDLYAGYDTCPKHGVTPPDRTRGCTCRAIGELFQDADRALCAAAPDLARTVKALHAQLASVTAERDRLQRACDEGLPRERIDCPACGQMHVEGPRHDDPSVDGRTRPHHTHRCYHCGHVWDSGRWSFGVDAPHGTSEAERLRAELKALRESHALTLLCLSEWLAPGTPHDAVTDEAVIAMAERVASEVARFRGLVDGLMHGEECPGDEDEDACDCGLTKMRRAVGGAR